MGTVATEFRYTENRTGAKVVADFRRLLDTGDIAKLTPGLYHVLTMHGGFIAHFDRHNFARIFAGNLAQLLDGEGDPLEDPFHFRWPALEDSGYSDGMSAGDVMRAIAEVAQELGPMVREREAKAAADHEVAILHALADKHGLRVSPA